MNLAIETTNLTRDFGQVRAVNQLNLRVEAGCFYGFLGPNGAGKSTTMRILTGYLSASGGTASIGGFDVFEQSLEVRRRVGYLPELAPLYGEMRVDGYLTLMCRLRGVPPSRRAGRIGCLRRRGFTRASRRRSAILPMSMPRPRATATW